MALVVLLVNINYSISTRDAIFGRSTSNALLANILAMHPCCCHLWLRQAHLIWLKRCTSQLTHTEVLDCHRLSRRPTDPVESIWSLISERAISALTSYQSLKLDMKIGGSDDDITNDCHSKKKKKKTNVVCNMCVYIHGYVSLSYTTTFTFMFTSCLKKRKKWYWRALSRERENGRMWCLYTYFSNVDGTAEIWQQWAIRRQKKLTENFLLFCPRVKAPHSGRVRRKIPKKLSVSVHIYSSQILPRCRTRSPAFLYDGPTHTQQLLNSLVALFVALEKKRRKQNNILMMIAKVSVSSFLFHFTLTSFKKKKRQIDFEIGESLSLGEEEDDFSSFLLYWWSRLSFDRWFYWCWPSVFWSTIAKLPVKSLSLTTKGKKTALSVSLTSSTGSTDLSYRPPYRYPYYDASGNGHLYYGYGGSELYTYNKFTPLEGIYRRWKHANISNFCFFLKHFYRYDKTIVKCK